MIIYFDCNSNPNSNSNLNDRILLGSSNENQIETILPVGNIMIFVKVYNKFGAYSEISLQFYVQPPKSIDLAFHTLVFLTGIFIILF